ncbi:MAG: hypothetical protein NT013_03970 [Planctomycetia bacterium]|nr:hypothetical protein [Planctomycetia bacterium]
MKLVHHSRGLPQDISALAAHAAVADPPRDLVAEAFRFAEELPNQADDPENFGHATEPHCTTNLSIFVRFQAVQKAE